MQKGRPRKYGKKIYTRNHCRLTPSFLYGELRKVEYRSMDALRRKPRHFKVDQTTPSSLDQGQSGSRRGFQVLCTSLADRGPVQPDEELLGLERCMSTIQAGFASMDSGFIRRLCLAPVIEHQWRRSGCKLCQSYTMATEKVHDCGRRASRLAPSNKDRISIGGKEIRDSPYFFPPIEILVFKQGSNITLVSCGSVNT